MDLFSSTFFYGLIFLFQEKNRLCRGLECRKIGYEMLIVHLGTLCSTYQFHLLILHL